jgi:hypothetical protein
MAQEALGPGSNTRHAFVFVHKLCEQGDQGIGGKMQNTEGVGGENAKRHHQLDLRWLG